MRLIRVGLLSNWTSLFIRSRDTRDVSAQRKGQGRTSENTAICKQRRKASGVTEPADTLILDCQPPQLWGSTFLLFKPPSLCYLVMAANWWSCLLFIPMQKSRDIFGCHNTRDPTGIYWVETRDAVLLKIIQCTGQAHMLIVSMLLINMLIAVLNENIRLIFVSRWKLLHYFKDKNLLLTSAFTDVS